MNVQDFPRKINAADQLVVCFDVSKDHLDGYAIHVRRGAVDREITVSINRRTDQIEEQLNELAEYAERHDLNGLCVVCEPTGGYDEELLRLARRQGHETAYVNTEHTAKMSTVESGDTGKTDPSDARTMSLIAAVDRTQAHRRLDEEYGRLRELGQVYDDSSRQATRARTRFHDVLKRLFCDYEKSADFLFGKTGAAVMEEYAWDPEAILEDGYDRFCERIKRHVKRARWTTLEALYEQAQRSGKMQWPERVRSLWKRRLRQLWADWKRYARRKEQAGQRIAQLYRQLQKRGKVPAPFEKVSALQLGRLIGEIGPLGDFDCWEEVEKYVGLNLRERASGDYEGELRITKKGRPLARKILGQMAYQLVQEKELYGEYYRRKQDQGMPGPKALVAVMRKVLKLIVGLYKSGQPYDRERVFTCRAQYRKAE
jgi:transposase